MRIYRNHAENTYKAGIAIIDFLEVLFKFIRKKSIDGINKIKQDRAAKQAAEREALLK